MYAQMRTVSQQAATAVTFASPKLHKSSINTWVCDYDAFGGKYKWLYLVQI